MAAAAVCSAPKPSALERFSEFSASTVKNVAGPAVGCEPAAKCELTISQRSSLSGRWFAAGLLTS